MSNLSICEQLGSELATTQFSSFQMNTFGYFEILPSQHPFHTKVWDRVTPNYAQLPALCVITHFVRNPAIHSSLSKAIFQTKLWNQVLFSTHHPQNIEGF